MVLSTLGAHFLLERSICGRRDSNKYTLNEDSTQYDNYSKFDILRVLCDDKALEAELS